MFSILRLHVNPCRVSVRIYVEHTRFEGEIAMKPATLLAAASACVFSIALVATLAEARAVLGAGHSHETRMQALAQGSPRIGLSLDSQRRVLDLCIRTLTHPDFGDAPAAQRTAVRAHCDAQVDHAARRYGADAYVWIAQARLHEQDQALVEMLADVDRARALAPQELWIALRRNDMVQPVEGILTAAEYRGQNADFAVMAQSRVGVRFLAARYLGEPAFRERITAVVETLPPEEQRRFLRNIRSVDNERRAARAAAIEASTQDLLP
jgi:hypothetical protein